MAKQEHSATDWVDAKAAADYLRCTPKSVRRYFHRKELLGRQRIRRGRIDFRWADVVRFGRGLSQDQE